MVFLRIFEWRKRWRDLWIDILFIFLYEVSVGGVVFMWFLNGYRRSYRCYDDSYKVLGREDWSLECVFILFLFFIEY